MKIKKIREYLANATTFIHTRDVIVGAGVGLALGIFAGNTTDSPHRVSAADIAPPAVAQAAAPGVIDSLHAFRKISESPAELRKLSAFDLNGNQVTVPPVGRVDLPEGVAKSVEKNQSFAFVGDYEGGKACAIFIDRNEYPEGYRLPLIKGASDVIVLNRDAALFHASTHEMTHCLNHDLKTASRFVDTAINHADPSMPASDYKKVLDAGWDVNDSIWEVHADLNSVLLGASATGDWTLFSEVVLPLRTAGYSHTHSTINALTNIINTIDPRQLKGRGVEEISALSANLFKKHFMDDKGNIDPKSQGVLKILNEWHAAGLDQTLRMPLDTQTDLDTLKAINQHNTLATGMVGEQAKSPNDAVFFFAMKYVAFKNQVASVNRYMPVDSQQAKQLRESYELSQEEVAQIGREFSRNHPELTKTFDQHVAAISQWQSYFNKQDNSPTLGKSVAPLMASALVAPDDAKAAERYRAAEQRIHQLVVDIRDNTSLPLDHLAAAISLKNTPSLRAEEAPSRSQRHERDLELH